MTDGTKSSEFWLVLVALVVSAAIVVVDSSLDGETWLDFAKWAVGAYALGRGVAKVSGKTSNSSSV